MTELRPSDKRHEVDDLVITCMDHRFIKTIAQILKNAYGVDMQSSDRLSYPAASKSIADKMLLSAIQTSYRLHNIKNIYIFDHTDCGGFGGLEAYDFDENQEAQDHFRHLEAARQTLSEVLPKLVVITAVIGLHGEEIQPGVNPTIASSNPRQ